MLPVTTYVAKTWVFTKVIINKLRVNQRATRKKILGVTPKDRKTSNRFRQRTRVQDVVEKLVMLKCQWAGHVAREWVNGGVR